MLKNFLKLIFDDYKLDNGFTNEFLINNNAFKIAFISSDNFNGSGAFISMVNLINILRNKYQLNVFVVLPEEGNGVELLEEFNIPFVIIKSFHWIIPVQNKDSIILKIKNFIKKFINKFAIYKISKLIQEYDIDLVHINTSYSYVGAVSSINNNVPFLWHLREFLEESMDYCIWDKNGYELINQSTKIIPISDSLKRKYETIFDSEKLIRIYNGIDDKKFYKPNKKIFEQDKLIFLIVGVVEYHKGQLDLAKACSKLYLNGFHNFEIWFVGGGNDLDIKNNILEIFDSSKMDNYKFFGFKKNVEEYYKKADISFTCSEFEAFGRTTVEAMLSGNLVIGSDSAGTKELIGDDRGILFKLHDSDDLYDKIKFAIDNPDLVKHIAQKGREYMYKNMTAEKNADNIFQLYSKVLLDKKL